MRISDWSSDVCSSDLGQRQQQADARRDVALAETRHQHQRAAEPDEDQQQREGLLGKQLGKHGKRRYPSAIMRSKRPWEKVVRLLSMKGSISKIGRASCRERVCQYV